MPVLAQQFRQRLQDADGERRDLGLVAKQEGLQLRQRGRPLVWPLQPAPRRQRWIGERRPLGGDIELLPPVGQAARALEARPRVAPEMRGIELVDGKLFFLAQIEKAARQVEEVLNLGMGDAVARDVEKTETVGVLAQLAKKVIAIPSG